MLAAFYGDAIRSESAIDRHDYSVRARRMDAKEKFGQFVAGKKLRHTVHSNSTTWQGRNIKESAMRQWQER
jgi:hypothetical protein